MAYSILYVGFVEADVGNGKKHLGTITSRVHECMNSYQRTDLVKP